MMCFEAKREENGVLGSMHSKKVSVHQTLFLLPAHCEVSKPAYIPP